MYPKLITFIFGLLFGLMVNGQVTYYPVVGRTNIRNCEISKIEITDLATYVSLVYEKERANLYQPRISVSSSTVIIDKATGIKYPIIKLGDDLLLNTKYLPKVGRGMNYNLSMVFPVLPSGTTSIDIIDQKGFEWKGISINNPDSSLISTWDEISLKTYWGNNGIDDLEGIYENFRFNKSRMALKKKDDMYNLIYLTGIENEKWKTGDINAILTKTASPNFFKVKWFMSDKKVNENLYASFESSLLRIIWTDGQPETLFLKLYPTSDVRKRDISKSSGTGFAISSDGYLVTNQHLVDRALKVNVRGVNGNFSKMYSAEVIIEDKNNDLAVVKINDPEFTGCGILPFIIDFSLADVGSEVYALGYPLRATMGDEVKLTNGIISSRTGFQGDITTYQISVPAQPGSSGGPLMNSNGNVVGVISSKHTGAENASYAIKTSYLMNLIQVITTAPLLSDTNTISSKALSEQVKLIKEYVYIIEASY